MALKQFLSDYEPLTRRSRGPESSANDFVEHGADQCAKPIPSLKHGASAIRPQDKDISTSSVQTNINEIWSTKRGLTAAYIGLFLFTIVLYFRPYELIPALSSFTAMAFVIALGTLLVFIPTQLGLEGTLTVRPREVNLILILCLTGLLSIPTAISPSMAWNTFSDTFIKAVVMFIVMVNVVRTERRLRWLLFLSIAVSVVLSVNAVSSYQKGNLAVEGYRVAGSIGGMFDNPNDLSLQLVTVFPLTVALFCSARSPLKKLIYAVCALFVIAGNTVTYSRGGSIGIVAVVMTLIWKLGRRNRLKVSIVGSLGLALFLAFAPGGYGVRLLSIVVPSLDPVGSSTQRKELLIQSAMVALRHPVFGVGMGNFRILSDRELQSHNAYTQVASEMGATAFICYVWFMVAPLKKLRQIERESFAEGRRSNFYYLSIGLQASLIGYMFSSFFLSVAYHWFIYYLVGYAICLRRIYALQKEKENSAKAVERDKRGELNIITSASVFEDQLLPSKILAK